MTTEAWDKDPSARSGAVTQLRARPGVAVLGPERPTRLRGATRMASGPERGGATRGRQDVGDAVVAATIVFPFPSFVVPPGPPSKSWRRRTRRVG